ncbi:MAB_1171c family putative transporter [Saccharopolyspora sp. SCSIO 74807]|uniref:MAB_1171c family putative transporter n=1 Tax=Saccharopolyspora sp. SCSIO 74807 TaxID=3118084 RepID=UPI0030CB489F
MLMVALTVLLWVATAVKAFQLVRAPDDRLLRTVAGGLAAAALAFTVGRAPIEGWLDNLVLGTPNLLRNLGMNLAFFSFLAFFVYSTHGRYSANQEMRRHRAIVAVLLLLECLAWATAPSSVRVSGEGSVHGALFQFVSVLALLYPLLASLPHAVRRSRRVQQRHLRIGLRILTVGLAAAVLANLLSATMTLVGVALGPDSAALAVLRRAYIVVILVAIPGLAIGLTLPIVTSMAAAIPLWWRHWREFRALRPLWKQMHEAFPDQTLRRPIGAVRPWSIHARRYRRACEIRDGLLMLAPYYPVRTPAGTLSTDTHAEQVREALRARAEARQDGSEAVGGPIATPIPQGVHGAGMDGDIRWLVELSQSLPRRGRAPSGHS